MNTIFKKNFNVSLKIVDVTKLIQVGMDSPNVNIKLLKMIRAEQLENKQHQLIDIGSSGLHKIQNAFKTGAESTVSGMKKILKRAFQIFYDSPARREDFLTVTNTNQFPQNFCATRFVTTYCIIY